MSHIKIDILFHFYFDKICLHEFPRKIEKLTVLGDISEVWKTKIQALNPIIKTYIGGIN